MLPQCHHATHDRIVEDICTHAVLYAASKEPWHATFSYMTLDGHTLTDADKKRLIEIMEYIAYGIIDGATKVYGRPPFFMYLYEQRGFMFTIQITDK